VTLEAVSGAVATVLAVVFIWPQVIRVYVKRSVEGVAAQSQLIGLSGTLMWLTYGVITDRLPMVLSNLNIELAILALMVMLVRKRALPIWQPVVVFVATLMFCVVAAQISSTIIGVTGVLIGTPAIFPQVWRALRTEHLLGVSVTSYMLLASMGTGWFTYGLTIGDPVVSYPNLVLIPSASFIAWKAWYSRRYAQIHQLSVGSR
jgi:uncharacterized protein with PQ loop repeat